MKPPSPSPLRTTMPLVPFYSSYKFPPSLKPHPQSHASKLVPHMPATSAPRYQFHLLPLAATNSEFDTATVFQGSPNKSESIEEDIEKVIYRCRFMTLLAVFGSLTGSILCFIKGCGYIVSSFMAYFVDRGKVILMLVEAIDVYLLGTVMLVFGMGLYELFVSNLDIAKSQSKENITSRSNLFGLFTLKERPRWLEIKSVSELKTKLGHVIVMLLLIGFFDKCKKAVIQSPVDLLCFSASVFLSSSCLFLLSKLTDSS